METHLATITDITWSDSRRSVTISASADAFGCMVYAGLTPNSYDVSGRDSVKLSDLEHGNNQAIYIRAVGIDEGGNEYADGEVFQTIAIPNPILGVVCGDEKEYIVDIVEKHANQDVERWKIGDRVVTVDKCPEIMPDEGGIIHGQIKLNEYGNNAIVDYEITAGPILRQSTPTNSTGTTRCAKIELSFNVLDVFPELSGSEIIDTRNAGSGSNPPSNRDHFKVKTQIYDQETGAVTLTLGNTDTFDDQDSAGWSIGYAGDVYFISSLSRYLNVTITGDRKTPRYVKVDNPPDKSFDVAFYMQFSSVDTPENKRFLGGIAPSVANLFKDLGT